MKRIRYSVATSLDGYIAGPNGEYDWILMDPDIDFAKIYERFDTLLMGRKSYEVTHAQGGGAMFGMDTYIFSRTLRQTDCPDVTVVSEHPEETLAAIKEKPGKDIWLFGGGSLFRSLLEFGVVDSVEVAIIPILLGGGVPLLPELEKRTELKLARHEVYQKTGTVMLEYALI
ncbi:MAG: dihydrofolate reductase family protein [Gammaproteobacteria bacterium]|nr:dihydrofolate reductase family protein [Gammaproteobacteria bacterium]